MSKVLNVLAILLVVVGGLNWGLVGLFNFDLVVYLLGVGTLATKVVYTLVGLGAVVVLVNVPKAVKMA